MVDTIDGQAVPTERSPLLRRRNTNDLVDEASAGYASPVPVVEGIPRRLKQRVVYLMYVLVFIGMFGSNLQPAAKIQLYEDAICRSYYEGDHSFVPGAGNLTGPGMQPETRCKVQPVQRELALVMGYEGFFQLLPALLTAIPFGLLADKIGRRKIIFLNMLGQLLGDFWVLGVVYWSSRVSMRLVALRGLVMLLGGGESVTSGLVHVMIADVTAEEERTNIFMWMHGTTVVSGFVTPMTSAILMESGHIWTTMVISEVLVIVGVFGVLPMIPETLGLRAKYMNEIESRASVRDRTEPAKTLLGRIKSGAMPLLLLLKGNPQALLLLAIYTPTLFAREAFVHLGLLYAGKKFGVPYSKGNVLLSLYQGAQAVGLFLIIPAITALVMSPRFIARPWTAWKRDRVYTIGSLLIMCIGYTILGWAPTLWFAVIGLIAVALSNTASATILSLLSATVRPDQVSVMFTTALTLAIVYMDAMAPLASILFNEGMRLGWGWVGLPFLSTAALLVPTLIASLFVSREKRMEPVREDEDDLLDI